MKINYNINQKYFYIIVKWKIILIVLVLRLWYITGKKYRQSRNATYSEKNIEVVDCNLIIIVFKFQCISITPWWCSIDDDDNKVFNRKFRIT